MRSKLKLILTAALVSALAVAGLSVAAGGDGGGDSGGKSTSAAPGAPGSYVVNGNRERGRPFGPEFRDEDVQAVLKQIHTAVADQAPQIAGPVIQKAEEAGKITAAQAGALRKAAQDIADGKKPDIRSLSRDADVHQVIHDAFAAAAKKAQEIGEPIIDKAVSDKKITEQQADAIREMLKHAPRGRGPGFKPRGHGGFGPGPPPAFADADVRDVLDDIRKATAAKAGDIAASVIDKAEADDKISAAQADRLREAAKSLAGGRPRGFPFRGLDMRDEDVREVIHDAFEAVAKQAPAIAKPIIDKAVADDKITARQARQIRSLIGHTGVHRGPGPFGHPGGPPPGGPGREGFGPGGGPPPGAPPSGDSAAPETPVAPGSPS
jgi:hypothetical protein